MAIGRGVAGVWVIIGCAAAAQARHPSFLLLCWRNAWTLLSHLMQQQQKLKVTSFSPSASSLRCDGKTFHRPGVEIRLPVSFTRRGEWRCCPTSSFRRPFWNSLVIFLRRKRSAIRLVRRMMECGELSKSGFQSLTEFTKKRWRRWNATSKPFLLLLLPISYIKIQIRCKTYGAPCPIGRSGTL